MNEFDNDFKNEFEIVTLRTGIKSLRSMERAETFHPVTGPWFEANALHVEQQRLVERSEKSSPFVVWDVGLGAAANTLAAIAAFLTAEKKSESSLENKIQIHSFDQSTRPLEFALKNREDLTYIQGYEKKIAELLKNHRVHISPKMEWFLHLGEFGEVLKQIAPSDNPRIPHPEAVLYDPYSPATNPEMWTLEHFKLLYSCLSPSTPCLLSNYTCSTAVRVGLLSAGFYVGKGRGVGLKSETTVASNHLEMLQEPLGMDWLAKVQRSTNSAPLKSNSYTKSTISEEDLMKLKAHLQFTR